MYGLGTCGSARLVLEPTAAPALAAEPPQHYSSQVVRCLCDWLLSSSLSRGLFSWCSFSGCGWSSSTRSSRVRIAPHSRVQLLSYSLRGAELSSSHRSCGSCPDQLSPAELEPTRRPPHWCSENQRSGSSAR